MARAMDETGEAKLFSANITADCHYEMLARGEYILEIFGPLDGAAAGACSMRQAEEC